MLVVSNIFLKYMTEKTFWLDDVRFATGPGMATAVAAHLAETGCKKIAYIGRGETPVPFWEGLHAQLVSASFADYEARVDPLRVIKDAVQYSIHSRGAEICDCMFETLHREIKTNKPVYALQSLLEKVAHDAGAEHALTWLTVAPAADYCYFRREESQRVAQMGDQVILGIYLLYHGHWAHALRMGTYGKASAAQERAFNIVLEMQEAGMMALRPGGNLYDVNTAIEQAFRAHYPTDKGIFRFRDVHGLGHSYEDPITSAPFPQPYVNPPKATSDAFLEIKPGMLFEFHPNYFEKGVAGGAIGDMVFVGEKGPELMVSYPREHVRWDR